jgi:hypothetical protein
MLGQKSADMHKEGEEPDIAAGQSIRLTADKDMIQIS